MTNAEPADDGKEHEDNHHADDEQKRSRRPSEPKAGGDTFSFGGKTIDFGELELRALGNTIHLTVMEAEFLRYLVHSEGRIVSRKSILENVLGIARRHRHPRYR